MTWQHSWPSAFRRAAEILWPDDYKLATGGPRKGRRAADERMQHRFDGYLAVRNLVQMRAQIDALAKDLALP